MLFLPEAGRAEALAVADEVVRAVREEAITHPAREPGACVTVSVGVSVADPRSTTSRNLRTADRTLYAAKAAGRDRVLFEAARGTAAGDARPCSDFASPATEFGLAAA